MGVSPMTLSQHSTDHVQKRARSTTEVAGLGARKPSAAFLYTKLALSFFHVASRVLARRLFRMTELGILEKFSSQDDTNK